MPDPAATSPVLTLVPHARDVLDLRVRWLNTPRVAATVYGAEGARTTTRAEQEAWFDRYERDSTRRLSTILLDGRPIGVVGLTGIDGAHGTAEVFIMIGEDDAVGHGYATRALRLLEDVAKALGLRRLVATTLRTNAAAIGCVRAAGYGDAPAPPDPREVALELQLGATERAP